MGINMWRWVEFIRSYGSLSSAGPSVCSICSFHRLIKIVFLFFLIFKYIFLNQHHNSISFPFQSSGYFGGNYSSIVVSGMKCTGNEATIDSCYHDTIGDVFCPGPPDDPNIAGVSCVESKIIMKFPFKG